MPQLGPWTLKNPWVLAPMAGVSEMPFRVLAFRMGAGLCPTELVSAQGLMRMNARTLRYLRHDAEVERPYVLQVFGGEPEVMARAAVMGKEAGAQVIDINMGCPVKKVTRSGAGSALLCDVPRAADVVRSIRESTGLPVTAKIRTGWDHHSRNYLDVAAALVDAGACAIAMHGRTRAQGYSGQADWDAIRQLKAALPGTLVIGNGDVKTVEDAHRMQEQTGCDAVMIGRGALGNPWIFRQLNGGLPPDNDERCAVVLAHFEAHLAFVGEELAAVRAFRKHLAWYAHGLRGASAFRAEVNTLDRTEVVHSAVRRFFQQAEADADAAGADDYDIDYRTALG
jgi:tRNA-dihydrouridine synthase B